MKITEYNLQKLGFFQLPDDEDKFGTWYKTYNYLGILVAFDRTLGSLLLVNLGDEGTVQSFLNGSLVVRLEYDRTYLLGFKDMYHIEAVDLCQWLNVWQIVTFSNLNKAVRYVDQFVEYLVLKDRPPFWYGDRVLYDGGKGTSIGSIVSVNNQNDTFGVLLSGGDSVVVDKTKLIKCPVSSLRKMVVSVSNPGKI